MKFPLVYLVDFIFFVAVREVRHGIHFLVGGTIDHGTALSAELEDAGFETEGTALVEGIVVFEVVRSSELSEFLAAGFESCH